MMARPIYVGVGECACGRVDSRLHYVPGAVMLERAICERCLEARGHEVPAPRTAEDVDVVDGKPQWRDSAVTMPYQREPMLHVGKLDLGEGHTFEVMLGSDDKLIGWLHTHPDARNPSTLCQSVCAVRPLDGAPIHQVICSDPLTLTPSLECRTCGAHGHVTNGKWEPC